MYTSKKTTTVFSASTCYVTATTVTACTRRKKKSIIADLYDEDADISFDTVTRYWIGYIIITRSRITLELPKYILQFKRGR